MLDTDMHCNRKLLSRFLELLGDRREGLSAIDHGGTIWLDLLTTFTLMATTSIARMLTLLFEYQINWSLIPTLRIAGLALSSHLLLYVLRLLLSALPLSLPELLRDLLLYLIRILSLHLLLKRLILIRLERWQ
jgi:hypothetical protein